MFAARNFYPTSYTVYHVLHYVNFYLQYTQFDPSEHGLDSGFRLTHYTQVLQVLTLPIRCIDLLIMLLYS